MSRLKTSWTMNDDRAKVRTPIYKKGAPRAPFFDGTGYVTRSYVPDVGRHCSRPRWGTLSRAINIRARIGEYSRGFPVSGVLWEASCAAGDISRWSGKSQEYEPLYVFWETLCGVGKARYTAHA